MGSRVEVDLLGTIFSIQTDQDPDYVGRIVGYLRTKIKEIEDSAGTKDRLRIAILSAILVADELFRERSRGGINPMPEDGDARRIADQMISTIDSVLEE